MLRTLLIVTAALFCTACSSLQPWVKPYERDRLADPIMSFERNPVSGVYLGHVYGVREGSRGGQGGNGGGCGCN